ncbi:hypothetical protein BDL97_06G048400 [Sphagnum fallax]|nr:hypothetical protein BDL97_06G048400 [Sphagnum fallax]
MASCKNNALRNVLHSRTVSSRRIHLTWQLAPHEVFKKSFMQACSARWRPISTPTNDATAIHPT